MKVKTEQEIEEIANKWAGYYQLTHRFSKEQARQFIIEFYTQAQQDILASSSKGFSQYVEGKLTIDGRIVVNRLDLHEQTWQAAKLSQAKEIEDRREEMIRLNTLLAKIANDCLIEAHKVEKLQKENEELKKVIESLKIIKEEEE